MVRGYVVVVSFSMPLESLTVLKANESVQWSLSDFTPLGEDLSHEQTLEACLESGGEPRDDNARGIRTDDRSY